MANSPLNGNPYDLSPPHRPVLGDVEYKPKSNAANEPPADPGTGLAAEEFQTIAALVVAAHRVIPALVVSVAWTGGAGTGYQIAEVASCNDAVVPSMIALDVLTPGHIQITWPSNMLPTKAFEPVADMNGATPLMIAAQSISNGVDVHIASWSGSADGPFTVFVG